MAALRRVTDPHDPYWDVNAVVYNDGDPLSEERRASKSHTHYAFEIDGETIGGLALLDMPMSLGPDTLKGVGIAGVAVLPHRRGGGVGKTMMTEAVRLCASRGYEMAALYAFREPFYAKSGFASAGWRASITAPGDQIPGCDNPLPAEMTDPSAWARLVEAQTEFAHRFSGCAIRDANLWRRVLGENRPLRVYIFGDPVEAWVVVSHKTEFWSEDRISDWGYLTPRAYRSALDFFRRLAINKTSMTWTEPVAAPFLASHLDHGTQVTLARPAMFRLLAPPPVRGDGEGTIRVRDSILPDLDGVFAISSEGWARTDATDADLSGPVGAITQGVLGEPSFADLARCGLVEGALPANLYPPQPVYHPDFY